MSRAMNPAVAAASAAPAVWLALLIELDFADEPMRMWAGLGDFAWGNRVFTGVGTLIGISAVEETAEVRAATTSISLSGIPAEVLDAAQNVVWQNRPARIWLALLDSGGAMMGEPVQILGGRMDQMVWTEGQDATISLTVENRLVDLQRAQVRRYTDRDQQDEYPGDKAFEFVTSLQNLELKWGQ